MHNGDPLLCMLGAVKNIETNKRKKVVNLFLKHSVNMMCAVPMKINV